MQTGMRSNSLWLSESVCRHGRRTIEAAGTDRRRFECSSNSRTLVNSPIPNRRDLAARKKNKNKIKITQIEQPKAGEVPAGREVSWLVCNESWTRPAPASSAPGNDSANKAAFSS